MAAVSPPFVGWTLAEALERLAEPKSWNAWLDAKTAWEKTHGPITEDDVESSTAQRFADAEWQNVTSAFATVKVGLWQALRDENVMATGQMEGGVIPVTQRDLHSFTRVRWHESSIEHPATGDRLTSIRVYPVVHSVDAASRLVGLGLPEAFFKCVLQDPEARVLAKEIPGRETEHASVFDEGRYPGPYVEYNWDLDVTPSELAYQFVKDVIIDLDGPLPKASIEIVCLCEVIVDRLQALRALLASGKLVASGTHTPSSNLPAVDQFQCK